MYVCQMLWTVIPGKIHCLPNGRKFERLSLVFQGFSEISYDKWISRAMASKTLKYERYFKSLT